MSDFSGYIAADELYDGPFCMLSIVDTHRQRRLVYEVLDQDPTQEDITCFFRRFRSYLDSRGLTLHGITTDGSPLYPKPILEVFGPIPHQVCEFHILQELTKAILHAVAKVRKGLNARLPKVGRGRPSKRTRRATQIRQRLQKKITDLFEHRYLFVQHVVTGPERKTLPRITRGFGSLRAVREIMDQVYRLFDRRCRTETALGKLAELRRRVGRFKSLRTSRQKLFSPNLEKALTFLDDKLLHATSNAVERANRRYNKMQKTVYRVRTQPLIVGRIAMDMRRDEQTEGREQTTFVLHLDRSERKAG